ncbi:MAG: hypothetical protein Q7K35_04575 [bacterium]|nr:hypothetical protein [bacterium]
MNTKLFLTAATMAVATLTSAIEAVDYLECPVNGELYIPGSFDGRVFYCDGVNGKHLGEDIKLLEKTPIKSIGNGDLIIYQKDGAYPYGFGELYAIILHDLGREYEFKDALGNKVKTRYIKSIYGHIRNYADRSDKVGTKLKWKLNSTDVQPVKRGEVIGYVNNDAENGDGKEHLHAGIALSKNVGAPFGYDNGSQGKNFAAMSEVIKIVSTPIVGQRSSAFVSDTMSQAFINAFNRHCPKIGWPVNYVHKWTSTFGYRVYLQDFQGDMDANAEHFGWNGQTALIYNNINDGFRSPAAYLVREGMWEYYRNNDGPAKFGEPFTEEVTGLRYATNKQPYRAGDAVRTGDTITVQKFNLVKDGYGNQGRTLVYNNNLDNFSI